MLRHPPSPAGWPGHVVGPNNPTENGLILRFKINRTVNVNAEFLTFFFYNFIQLLLLCIQTMPGLNT